MHIFTKAYSVLTGRSVSDNGLSNNSSWKIGSPTTPETRIPSDVHSVSRPAYQIYINNNTCKEMRTRLHDACKDVDTTLTTNEVSFQSNANGDNAKSVDEFVRLKLNIEMIELYYGSESISQFEKQEIERSLQRHRKIIEDLHTNLSSMQNVKSNSEVTKPNKTGLPNDQGRPIREMSGGELQEPNDSKGQNMTEIITSDSGNSDVDTNTDVANHTNQGSSNIQIELAQQRAVLAQIEQDRQRRIQDRKTKEDHAFEQKHDVQENRKMELAKKTEEVAGVIENGIKRTKQRKQKFDEWMDKVD